MKEMSSIHSYCKSQHYIALSIVNTVKNLTLKQGCSLRKYKKQKFEMCLKIETVRKMFFKYLFSLLNYEAKVWGKYTLET